MKFILISITKRVDSTRKVGMFFVTRQGLPLPGAYIAAFLGVTRKMLDLFNGTFSNEISDGIFMTPSLSMRKMLYRVSPFCFIEFSPFCFMPCPLMSVWNLTVDCRLVFILQRVDDRVCPRLNLYMVFIIYLSFILYKNSLTKVTIDTIITHGTSPKNEPFIRTISPRVLYLNYSLSQNIKNIRLCLPTKCLNGVLRIFKVMKSGPAEAILKWCFLKSIYPSSFTKTVWQKFWNFLDYLRCYICLKSCKCKTKRRV